MLIYVTYAGLFRYSLVIIGVAMFVLMIAVYRNKKK